MVFLSLTATERAIYDKLPAELKKAWGGKVVIETGTAWETKEELQTRARVVLENMEPTLGEELRSLLLKLSEGADAPTEKLLGTSKQLLPDLLFIIGASGMSLLIAQELAEATTAEDIASAAMLSGLRHTLLNKSSTAVHG